MGADACRVDKWLFHARFFRSRSAAARFVESGALRVNKQRVEKAHRTVRPGDVLTFALGGSVRVVRIRQVAARRGAPALARTLYEEVARLAGARPLDIRRPWDI